ncbi:chymotrypsin family serine protease [Nocardia suismassiliense]|uniref:peptidase S1 family protein n=1 Tax=Nocardia suismassiliense TaxID=2077092 RepID=UPI000D1F725B|nr:peptidase S1 family protein [Nocardia suismassiliense]
MTRTALAFAAATATALLGTAAAQAQADDTPPTVGGGSGILVDSKVGCTLTTIGRDSADRLVGLTAGHCGEPGSVVVVEGDPNGAAVGRFAYSDRTLDYAVIEFDAQRVRPVRGVGGTTITDLGAPAQFPTVVCKRGSTSGTSCGVVWGDVRATSTETWTQMCVMKGDSGAPVVVGTTLVGMVNAYLGVGCLGPQVGTNISAITNDLNARGGVGAGYQPL